MNIPPDTCMFSKFVVRYVTEMYYCEDFKESEMHQDSTPYVQEIISYCRFIQLDNRFAKYIIGIVFEKTQDVGGRFPSFGEDTIMYLYGVMKEVSLVALFKGLHPDDVNTLARKIKGDDLQDLLMHLEYAHRLYYLTGETLNLIPHMLTNKNINFGLDQIKAAFKVMQSDDIEKICKVAILGVADNQQETNGNLLRILEAAVEHLDSGRHKEVKILANFLHRDLAYDRDPPSDDSDDSDDSDSDLYGSYDDYP
jgi:hypothetical protein